MDTKHYNIVAVGDILELGKKGGSLQYESSSGVFKLMNPAKTSTARIEIDDAVNPNEAVTLSQLNALNLSDVGASTYGTSLAQATDAPDARSILNLGDASTKNTGTASGQIPVRDGNGDVTGNITGNSATTDALNTAIDISLTGDVSGTVSSTDLSSNVSINTTVNAISTGVVAKLTYLNSNSTLSINTKYFIAGNNTYTLPATSGLSIGDIVEVRSKIADDPQVQVDNNTTESIVTPSSTVNSITMDTAAHYIFVFNGTDWELII